jgi:transcriptional regulator with GAF, ATPase, and Fis domain
MAGSLASLVTWRNNEAAHRQIEVALHALAERTKRLEIIRGVTEEITRELDLTTLLELITRRTAELIGVPSSAIYVWDTIVETFIPRAWYGLGDWMQDVRFRMGEGIPGAIGQCREGMIVNDYRASPYANQLFIEHTGITAVLTSPLLYHGRLLGVITLNNGHTGRHFTEQDGQRFPGPRHRHSPSCRRRQRSPCKLSGADHAARSPIGSHAFPLLDWGQV